MTTGFNKVYTIVEFAVLTGISLTMAYVFYEFYKPDYPDCYAAQSSSRAYSEPIDNHGDEWMDETEQNMTPLFKQWLLYGVIFYIIFFFIRLIMFAGALFQSFYTVAGGHVASTILFTCSFFWTISGGSMMNSHNAKVCSGFFLSSLNPPQADTSMYLEQEGTFIRRYLIYSWIAHAIFFVSLTVFSAFACSILARRGSKEAEKDEFDMFGRRKF